MKTSSRNGFGTKLLFHRPAGTGLFEATVWSVAGWVWMDSRRERLYTLAAQQSPAAAQPAGR